MSIAWLYDLTSACTCKFINTCMCMCSGFALLMIFLDYYSDSTTSQDAGAGQRHSHALKIQSSTTLCCSCGCILWHMLTSHFVLLNSSHLICLFGEFAVLYIIIHNIIITEHHWKQGYIIIMVEQPFIDLPSNTSLSFSLKNRTLV